MQNFEHVGNVEIAPIIAALSSYSDAFESGNWRREMHFSPHRDSDTLVLRGCGSTKPRAILNSLEVIDEPALEIAAFGAAVNSIANVVGKPLARAMIVRLAAGGEVTRHTDIGAYAEATERYHLPLITNDRAWLEVDGEVKHLDAGSLYHFNKHAPHSAGNGGNEPRTHLIVDVFLGGK